MRWELRAEASPEETMQGAGPHSGPKADGQPVFVSRAWPPARDGRGDGRDSQPRASPAKSNLCVGHGERTPGPRAVVCCQSGPLAR